MSRGNDTSGAPIWIGTTKLANANTIGVAKNSSMIVPCIVNSWLYCSGREELHARAGPARPASAAPSGRRAGRTRTTVTMYMIPICFASVVRSIRANAEPLTCSRTGQGRVTIGLGATVVTNGLRFSFVPLGTRWYRRAVIARRIVPGRRSAARGGVTRSTRAYSGPSRSR